MKKVEHICGIYAIRNKVNNKSYIGMSRDIHKRWMDHIFELNNKNHRNKHLQSAWNKYGKDSFEFFILKECCLSDLRDLEILFIALFDTTKSEKGYNLTGGGDGLAEYNEELRKAKSETLKRHYKENPEKAKQRFEAITKAVRTPEAREFKRQQTLKQFQDEEFYRKYRELRSSEEYRKKISESHKGHRPSEKARINNLKAISKPVICIETGKVFESAKAAARSLPGNVNINAVVCGRRKSAGGYHWKYYDVA